jgi:hypothetical protein
MGGAIARRDRQVPNLNDGASNRDRRKLSPDFPNGQLSPWKTERTRTFYNRWYGLALQVAESQPIASSR